MQPGSFRKYFARFLLTVLTLSYAQLNLSQQSLADTTSAPWQDKESQEKKLKLLQHEIAEIKSWIETDQKKQTKLEKVLRRTEKKLQNNIHQINQRQKEIDNFQTEIRKLKLKETEHLHTLKQNQKLLAKQIKLRYELGQEPTIKLLLNAEDPVSMQRLITYYGYLNAARQKEIENFRETIKNLEQVQRDILTKHQWLIRSQDQLAQSRKDLHSQRQQRKATLTKLNTALNAKQNQLARKEESRQQLARLINELDRAILNLELETGPEPFAQQRGKLPWPAKGLVRKSNEKIDSPSPQPHGLFLKTPTNQSVMAVHHGRVVFADWLRGFGLLIILDHGDSYMSLYGYNEVLLKNTGDWVKSGETIASTGRGDRAQSGLYFEIRHQGQPEKTLAWLREDRGN